MPTIQLTFPRQTKLYPVKYILSVLADVGSHIQNPGQIKQTCLCEQYRQVQDGILLEVTCHEVIQSLYD